MGTIINSIIVGSGGSGPTGLYREFELDANGVLQSNTTTTHIMDFTGISDVGNFQLSRAYDGNTRISGAIEMKDLTTITGTDACLGTFRGCTGITAVDLSSLTEIIGSTSTGDNSCNGMFDGCTGITAVDLSSLTTISSPYGCSRMFYGCSGIINLDISSLKTISGTNACQYMFTNCTSLASVDLSNLESAKGCKSMFSNCTGIITADLSSLQTIDSSGCESMFYGCTSLTSVDLSSLTTINNVSTCYNMFYGCTSLTSLSFPAITTTSFGTRKNQFADMCKNIPSITLHFPSNVQTQVEALTGYSTTAPFGAVSGTVLFDLPATS